MLQLLRADAASRDEPSDTATRPTGAQRLDFSSLMSVLKVSAFILSRTLRVSSFHISANLFSSFLPLKLTRGPTSFVCEAECLRICCRSSRSAAALWPSLVPS